MDCFIQAEIERIALCSSTQIGKTEGIFNMLGYAIDQDPGPGMIVYPIDKLAERVSENRIEPMVIGSPALADKYNKRASEKLELQFKTMTLYLSGANSPATLANVPIRYLFRDEIDKFPRWSGKEADPMKLSEERTRTFYNKKIVDVSTPTLKTGNIWQAIEAADVLYRYWVPCPHCGGWQQFSFKQIKWPKDFDDGNKIRDTAWYECSECHAKIYDTHKMEMLRAGRWKPDKEPAGRVRFVAFHINAIYSPWVTFGQVAKEFWDSKDFPEKLMNFVNSWLAEPWEDKAAAMDSDKVLERQSDLPEGVVPEYTQLLTGGVDVQKGYMYWEIDAWGAKLTSQNIAHGIVESWEELEEIMNKRWPDTNGEAKWQVNLCGIDAGFDTEAVYEFCLEHQDWAVPVKGSSNPMTARYRRTIIDNPGSKAYGQALYIVDTDQYKNLIAARLNKPIGIGCFMVYAECDEDYARQLTAEHKIRERKGDREIETWVPKTSAAKNHYLDCRVYSSVAADLLHVRYLNELKETSQTPPVRQSEKDNDDWLADKGEGWIK